MLILPDARQRVARLTSGEEDCSPAMRRAAHPSRRFSFWHSLRGCRIMSR
jgi:hypothetical protein